MFSAKGCIDDAFSETDWHPRANRLDRRKEANKVFFMLVPILNYTLFYHLPDGPYVSMPVFGATFWLASGKAINSLPRLFCSSML